MRKGKEGRSEGEEGRSKEGKEKGSEEGKDAREGVRKERREGRFNKQVQQYTIYYQLTVFTSIGTRSQSN